METKQKERIRRLMELLKKTDRIHLKEAARMLEVSVMTIRRDLSLENDEPLPLTLLGGYVVMVNKPSSPSVSAAPAGKAPTTGTICPSPSSPPGWSAKTTWSFLITAARCRW